MLLAIEPRPAGLAEDRDPLEIPPRRPMRKALGEAFPLPQAGFLARRRRNHLPIGTDGQPAERRRPAIEHVGQPDRFVTRVAGEQFVAAIAGECHGHVLPGQLGKIPGRQGRAVGKGLVKMPDEPRQDLHRLAARRGTPRESFRIARPPAGRSAFRHIPARGSRWKTSAMARR